MVLGLGDLAPWLVTNLNLLFPLLFKLAGRVVELRRHGAICFLRICGCLYRVSYSRQAPTMPVWCLLRSNGHIGYDVTATATGPSLAHFLISTTSDIVIEFTVRQLQVMQVNVYMVQETLTEENLPRAYCTWTHVSVRGVSCGSFLFKVILLFLVGLERP